MTFRLASCAAVMVAALSPLSAFAVIQYTLTDLGPGIAYGINNSGQVTGIAGRIDLNSWQAFSYTNGVKTSFGSAAFLHNFSWGFGINANGTIAGTYSNSSNSLGLPSNAFTWKAGSGLTRPLDDALGINDSGAVVGNRVNAANSALYNAAIFSNGTVTDLGTLGGNSSQGNAINNLGDVAGTARDAAGKDHAALWKNGTVTALSPNSGNSPSAAVALNDSDMVVGVSATSLGANHATLWQNSNIVDLTPSSLDSYAYGINNPGAVVGYDGVAFIWQNGQEQLLNNLIAPNSPLSLIVAYDINDSGQIVGYGRTSTNITDAFLLTPVPEPSTAALLGLAPWALWRTRRRRG